MATHEYRPRLPDRKVDNSTEWTQQNFMLRREVLDTCDRFDASPDTQDAVVTRRNNIVSITNTDENAAQTGVKYHFSFRHLNDGETSLDFFVTEAVIPGSLSKTATKSRNYVVFWNKKGELRPEHSSYEIFTSAPIGSDIPVVEEPPKLEPGENRSVIEEAWWGSMDDFYSFSVLRSEQLLDDLEQFRIATGLQKA